MRTKFLSESPKGRNNMEDLGIDGRTDLKETVGKVWTVFPRTGGGLL
jgi:hypothetical protein